MGCLVLGRGGRGGNIKVSHTHAHAHTHIRKPKVAVFVVWDALLDHNKTTKAQPTESERSRVNNTTRDASKF